MYGSSGARLLESWGNCGVSQTCISPPWAGSAFKKSMTELKSKFGMLGSKFNDDVVDQGVNIPKDNGTFLLLVSQ